MCEAQDDAAVASDIAAHRRDYDIVPRSGGLHQREM
jgi:hypothetical protein